MFKAKAPNILKKGIAGSLPKSHITSPASGRKGALGNMSQPSKKEEGTNVSAPICQGAATCPDCGKALSHSHTSQATDYDNDGE